LYALAAGLPAVVVSMAVLWFGDYTPKVQWTLTALIAGVWLGFAFAARERVVFPLRTLSNLLAALREGDYSLRARTAKNDALADVMQEVNMMSEMLREQRLGALEATTLLRTVMREIDVAVLAFDEKSKLRLINRAGERLLARPAERLLDLRAEELELGEYLGGPAVRTDEHSFPGGSGRWSIRRTTFREHGMPHQLLVISDLTRELREEELKAWQRLVRVMGHELNNSLAPIKSLAASLENLIDRPARNDWQDDMRQGLAVIGSRAEALSRFMSQYARLAKLPEPKLEPVNVSAWVRRVAGLETRMAVRIEPGPELLVEGDGDQLEQLLINLIRNAVDAALEVQGGVRVGWRKNDRELEVWVEDDGPGLSSNANLFVPFYTTKPGGSGIGLVLCRKIIENHGGTLTLQNRNGARGCEARLRLPLRLLSTGQDLTAGS
jgi:nitrogen fixation/metabolism regulation signal transduction histidine kinase